ncbi:MAG: hypothetical protein ACI9KE_003509 [Polyangiales bacterium]|jgi:hypothetical protein
MHSYSRMVLAACLLLGACGAEAGDTERTDAGRDVNETSDVGSAGDVGEEPDAGGDEDAGSDAAMPDSGPTIPDDLASRYCDAYNDFGTMCDVPGAGADCDEGETCVVNALRAVVRQPVVECLEARECGESDGTCFDISTFDIDPTPAFDEFATTCMERRTECEDSFEAFHCSFAVLSDATLERYSRCLRTNCAGINSCVGRIVGCIDEE